VLLFDVGAQLVVSLRLCRPRFDRYLDLASNAYPEIRENLFD
jgi:hypothetical protein